MTIYKLVEHIKYDFEENDEKKYALEDEIAAKQEMIASVEDGKYPDMKKALYLSETSLEIWNCLSEGMSLEETYEFLSQKFNADYQIVVNGTSEFIEQLTANKYIFKQ